MDFDMLGLAPRLVAALAEQGITDPTQTQAIPHAMNGRDVMGLAQTGTGKTAAFGLPMIDRLMKSPGKHAPKSARALVLAPTRELAKQIADNLTAYTQGSHLKTVLVVGGAGINGQIKRMEGGCSLLVATPGRLIDLLDRRAVNLSQTEFLVLDEADQMLDMGFIHALRRIAPLLPKERQTMLFSATMPKQMEELASAYLTDAVRVQVNPPGKAADKITQGVHWAQDKGDKIDILKAYLSDEPDGLSLVFARTKHGAERLMKQLCASGFDAVSIHGNKSQGQRDRALAAFRDGKARVLVATDVAARGIDIPGGSHVFNFDLPNVAENYVHRIGRTARAGADGDAISLVTGDELGYLRDIQKLMKIDIPVLGGNRPEELAPPKQGRGGNGGGGGGGRGRGPRRGGGKPKAAAKPKSEGQGAKKPARSGQRRRRSRSRSAA